MNTSTGISAIENVGPTLPVNACICTGWINEDNVFVNCVAWFVPVLGPVKRSVLFTAVVDGGAFELLGPVNRCVLFIAVVDGGDALVTAINCLEDCDGDVSICCVTFPVGGGGTGSSSSSVSQSSNSSSLPSMNGSS